MKHCLEGFEPALVGRLFLQGRREYLDPRLSAVLLLLEIIGDSALSRRHLNSRENVALEWRLGEAASGGPQESVSRSEPSGQQFRQYRRPVLE